MNARLLDELMCHEVDWNNWFTRNVMKILKHYFPLKGVFLPEVLLGFASCSTDLGRWLACSLVIFSITLCYFCVVLSLKFIGVLHFSFVLWVFAELI